jgi:hypothetical protein
MARKAQAKRKTETKPDAPPRQRSQSAFKLSDVSRAIRAAKDAKLPIGKVEIARNGCITISPRPDDVPQQGNAPGSRSTAPTRRTATASGACPSGAAASRVYLTGIPWSEDFMRPNFSDQISQRHSGLAYGGLFSCLMGPSKPHAFACA